MFTGEKVAQMAAYFMDKEAKPQMAILKLVKLLYLADRESIDKHDEPISFDYMVSMEHGPVLSRTLDLINGFVKDANADQWDAWISAREAHNVALKKSASRDRLDHLSDADIEVLAAVWDKFGHMDKWEIRNYTHEHLDEWSDPEGSSMPISEIELLLALGRSEDEANEIAQAICEQRQLDRVISQV